MAQADRTVLQDIEALLQHVSQTTSQRHFVIVGDFSIVGGLVEPPREMMMSQWVEMYAKHRPDDFSTTNSTSSVLRSKCGLQAKPVSPAFIPAPEHWESRLCPITVARGVTA